MVDTVQPRGLIRFELIGVVATKEDKAAEMEYRGARHQTSGFYGERGWMSRIKTAPPAEGDKCS